MAKTGLQANERMYEEVPGIGPELKGQHLQGAAAHLATRERMLEGGYTLEEVEQYFATLGNKGGGS